MLFYYYNSFFFRMIKSKKKGTNHFLYKPLGITAEKNPEGILII